MKIRPLDSPALRSLSERGFTLIELLVVISIIAVLAGLLFPAMGAVRTSARKASAANDCMQIVNAVKNFYTDYGKYPVDGEGTFVSGNKDVIDELRALSTATLNSRKIRYLEVKELPGAPDFASRPRGAVIKATGSTAQSSDWYDPWRNPYLIFIDDDYDGSVETSGFGNNDYNDTLQVGVAAGSHGPPAKEQSTFNASNYKNPVASWK